MPVFEKNGESVPVEESKACVVSDPQNFTAELVRELFARESERSAYDDKSEELDRFQEDVVDFCLKQTNISHFIVEYWLQKV